MADLFITIDRHGIHEERIPGIHSTGRRPPRPSDPDEPAARQPSDRQYIGPPATPKQLDYLKSLCNELGHEMPAETIDKFSASQLITKLSDQKKAGRVEVNFGINIYRFINEEQPEDGLVSVVLDDSEDERWSDERAYWALDKDEWEYVIPTGRYAVKNEEGAQNDIAFYSVWVKDDGARWNVKRWASDALESIPSATIPTILNKIAADPSEASRRFGLAIGCCGVCGRTLTNKESRRKGIGPICEARVGF